MKRRSFLYCRRTSSLLYLSLIVVGVLVDGAPYFLLTSSRPKCVTVEGPRNTAFVLTYDAPDMVLLPEDDSELGQKQQQQDEKQDEKQEKKEAASPPNKNSNDGLDERFNKRFQDKMIALQRAGRQMTDISVVIHQTGETAREWKQQQQEGTVAAGGRLRKELKERKGTVEYATAGERDAPIEVCIQSMAADPKNPSRVALSIAQKEHVKITTNKINKKMQRQQQQRIQQQQEQVQGKLSALGNELEQLEVKVDLILVNADAAKEREVHFHEQSLAMNRASRYWPMIHVGVLLITGFTIANHMIHFFSKRHIY